MIETKNALEIVSFLIFALLYLNINLIIFLRSRISKKFYYIFEIYLSSLKKNKVVYRNYKL
mgnify:CR=1 FL=1